MKNPWVIIGLVTVALFAGAFWFAGQAEEANNEGIELVTHVKGNPDATVVLEEFSDFQCPACASAFPFVTELTEQFADDLRFEYRHFPLEAIHPYALQAAMAAEAAGQQGKFYEFHDLLFENQETWSRSATPNVFFQQYAEELELDIDQFKRQANASVLRDHARAELVAGRDRGVTGTPTFFLNGELLRTADGGNLSYAEIAALVAAAISGEVVVPAVDSVTQAVEAAAEEGGVRFGI